MHNAAEKKNRYARGLEKQLVRDYNEATRVCPFPGESLCRGTAIHIFQTMFHVMFPSVLPRLLWFWWQTPMGCQKCSLQYPLNLCFVFPWPISWVNSLFQSKRNCFREEKGINLLQAIHQILFALLQVGCLSGVIPNFYLFLLLKLLKKTRDDSCSKESDFR